MGKIQDSGFGIQEDKPKEDNIGKPELVALPESRILNPESSEYGGRPGPDPTRYGDWEIKGKCVDF